MCACSCYVCSLPPFFKFTHCIPFFIFSPKVAAKYGRSAVPSALKIAGDVFAVMPVAAVLPSANSLILHGGLPRITDKNAMRRGSTQSRAWGLVDLAKIPRDRSRNRSVCFLREEAEAGGGLSSGVGGGGGKSSSSSPPPRKSSSRSSNQTTQTSVGSSDYDEKENNDEGWDAWAEAEALDKAQAKVDALVLQDLLWSDPG